MITILKDAFALHMQRKAAHNRRFFLSRKKTNVYNALLQTFQNSGFIKRRAQSLESQSGSILKYPTGQNAVSKQPCEIVFHLN